MKLRVLPLFMFLIALGLAPLNAEDRVFSGPQAGEKLPEFKVRGVFDAAGKELDFVKQAAGKPIVLVFIHDMNRMSLRMTQVLTHYSAGRASAGLATGVVWLGDDVTEAENNIKRQGHALSREAPTGISVDGKEGPGSYGLNRNVTLTVLVGKAGQVTANFALIQPSIAADLPKILTEIAKVTGEPVATLEDLFILNGTKVQGPLITLIDRTSKPEDVDRAATSIEQTLKKDEAGKKEFARVLLQVEKKGLLEMHGTPPAHKYLRKWAQEFASEAQSAAPKTDQKTGAGNQ